MTDADSPRSLNCPNCGAPLDFPEGQASVRCRFCDSTIERSIADLTDDDDAHVIQIDASSSRTPGAAAGPARRFVLKMRNGQPVLIEMGAEPPRPPTTEQMFSATRSANAAAAAAARSRSYKAPRTYTAPKPASLASRLGCAAAVVAVIACGLVGGFIAFNSNPQGNLVVRQLMAGQTDRAMETLGTVGSNILLSRNALMIPGLDDGPEQAILLSMQYSVTSDKRAFRLIAVDTSTRKLLWQSAVLAPELYDTRIVYNNDLLFILNGPEVVALRRADGATAWTAPLADEIALNLCDGCLQLVGERLAALSDDGTLEVFDTATGESQWSIRADQDSPRGLYVLGQRLAFMDRNADTRGVLRTFDPASGDERAVLPSCETSDERQESPDWTTSLAPAPDGAGFYMAFGYFPTCLQRWNAHSLELDWNAFLPEDFATSIENVTPLIADGTLYLAYEHQVLAVSAADGQARPILADEEYSFNVEAFHDGHLVLQAQRSRGSTRYEIWDVVVATGQVRWKYDLGDNPPMDLGGIIDNNAPDWVVHASEAGLRVLRFKSAEDDRSHSIVLETLDWETGESSGQKETRLELPTIIFSAPDWTRWKGDTLWMVIENKLLAFDAANSQVTYRWP